MGTPIVFSTRTYDYLADDLCRGGIAAERGAVVREVFPDGEHYQRLAGQVDSRDVILIGGTVSDADTLELYDLAGALVEGGADSLTMVVPYFGYSTMERATKPGEVVTAKSRARLLSSIPATRNGNKIVLFDLHTEGLPYYFEGNLRAFHMYGKPLIKNIILALSEGQEFVLACTDAGRAKWVESLANDMGVAASFVFKQRLSGSETKVSAVSAQVKGKRVIIYDDMIRTGGSLSGAAQAYLDAGAKDISAVTTHGVFPGGSLERLLDGGLFRKIACTDSHPNARQAGRMSHIDVVPITKLLANFLREHSLAG